MLATQVTELTLGGRFSGPPATANGGYACGTIAELLGGDVEVTLRRPPPLGRPLRLRVGDGDAVVHHGDQLPVPAQQRVGLDEEARPADSGRTRLTAASRARSAGSSRGRGTWRRNRLSWWRRRRTSRSLLASSRPSWVSSWIEWHSVR